MLDLRTLLAVLVVGNLVLATALWVGAGRRLREDVALWSFALVAQALALALYAIRGASQQSAFVLGTSLLGLSWTLQAAALLAFDRRHLPVWVHTAVIAGVAVPLSLLIGDLPGALLFAGVILGTELVALAAISWQLHAASPGARAVFVTAFSLGALAFYIRGVSAMLSSTPLAAFVAPSPFESALFMALYAMGLATSLCFLVLRREAVESASRKLPSVDPLTGAFSRGSFRETAEREFSRARRAGHPLSLIRVDLDHFAELTERHGARFGDTVLKRFAEIARAALRREDMLVRLGTEKFLIMLPDVPGPGAVVVAGRIRREVEEEPFEENAQRIAVTVSAGVAARLDEGPESIDGLIARADQALALAQRRGANRVVALSLGRSIAA
jgi:diguanylate cyclase (GGDEF)-like protein